jgi:hypothetical protein
VDTRDATRISGRCCTLDDGRRRAGGAPAAPTTRALRTYAGGGPVPVGRSLASLPCTVDSTRTGWVIIRPTHPPTHPLGAPCPRKQRLKSGSCRGASHVKADGKGQTQKLMPRPEHTRFFFSLITPSGLREGSLHIIKYAHHLYIFIRVFIPVPLYIYHLRNLFPEQAMDR